MSETTTTLTPPPIMRLRLPALIVGIVCLALCAIGGTMFSADSFFRSYLIAWLLWFGVAMGAMSIVMMHYLVGGGWGLMVRRPGEAAALTLPLLLLLAIPMGFGLRQLFPWADPSQWQGDAVLEHRRPFFSAGAVVGRSIGYLVLWSLLAWRLRAGSLARDAAVGDRPRLIQLDYRLARLSALGLVLYFITMSASAVDWIMSREAHWYSSVFGFTIIVGQTCSGLVVLILTLFLLSKTEPVRTLCRPRYSQDLGNLLLCVVILWAYMNFSQFLVNWLGNTQGEIHWYYHRMHGGWQWVGVILIVVHFFGPFFAMLSQRAKRNLNLLALVALGLLVMRAMDCIWMIDPSSPTDEPGGVSWMVLPAVAGIGGIWIAVFLWILGRAPILPVPDTEQLRAAAEADKSEEELDEAEEQEQSRPAGAAAPA